MSIIKALSAPQQQREVVQIIDGVQFSTIRAKLVADNGKGQALYYDARPERVANPIDQARSADVQPVPCYFLGKVCTTPAVARVDAYLFT